MNGYSSDRGWSNKFEPIIKKALGALLGRLLINEEASDRHQATDLCHQDEQLMVLNFKPYTFGCRVRRHAYYWHKNYSGSFDYRYQFTIRNTRPSGHKSEFDKIADGWCDYLFYGISNPAEDGSGFSIYSIIDLKVFRAELIRKGAHSGWIQMAHGKNNRDNSSDFYAFSFSDFQPSLITHRYEPQQQLKMEIERNIV